MQVHINGAAEDVSEGLSLSELIAQLHLRADQVAIELNQQVLRRSLWEVTKLKAGDRIEIVHFVGGGCSSEFSLQAVVSIADAKPQTKV